MSTTNFFITLFSLLILASCEQRTGIAGNNNTGNTVVITENATINSDKKILGKAPIDIFYLLKIGTSMQYIKQLLGEPKRNEFNKNLGYNQYLWDLENLYIRVSSDSLDKTAEAIEFKLKDTNSRFLLDSIYTQGLLKNKFFGELTYKDVIGSPFYIYKGYRGLTTNLAVIPGYMANRLIRYEFTSFYDLQEDAEAEGDFVETPFSRLVDKLQVDYDVKTPQYKYHEEEREGYTNIWEIEDEEMLKIIENALSNDRIEVIRIIRDYDGNEKYYYTGWEIGFYNFENIVKT